MYSGDKMNDPISFHFSFIVRCWRDSNGALRGWLVDAHTQQSQPFVGGEELAARIEILAAPAEPLDAPAADAIHPDGL